MITRNQDTITCPYLVGDLYYTTREGNPAQTWPGTEWEAVQDCFVRGADASHPAGSTGGSWTHKQTSAEMPRHDHTLFTQDGGSSQSEGKSTLAPGWSNTWREFGAAMNASGEGQPMDITNPYYSAYIWRRTG